MRKKVLCRRSYALGNVSSTVLALRCRVVPKSFSRDSCRPGRHGQWHGQSGRQQVLVHAAASATGLRQQPAEWWYAALYGCKRARQVLKSTASAQPDCALPHKRPAPCQPSIFVQQPELMWAQACHPH